LVAFVAMRVSAESFTGDELALAVTVDIDPLQIVILAAERIDFVARPSAFAGSADVLLPPPQSVGVTLAADGFVSAATVDVFDEDRHARGASEIEVGMPDPFAVVGIGRCFQPTVGQNEIAAAAAGDVAETEAVALAVVFTTFE